MADESAREALVAHLEFYRELGIDGLSGDAVWSARADSAVRPSVAVSPAAIESAPPRGTAAVSHERDVPPTTAKPRAMVLQEIRDDIGDCTRCKLHAQGRTQIVFGVGNPQADLMFVGEAPGADEDIQGEPFVGRAGQLLTRIIEAMGRTRADVYIANVIKCRPPGNRNPEPDEVATCQPFLFRQIDSIQPVAIVALGTFAAQTLLDTKDPISRLRGKVWKCRGARLVPTFHPAYLLRNPSSKRDVWEDMKVVMSLLPAKS